MVMGGANLQMHVARSGSPRVVRTVQVVAPISAELTFEVRHNVVS